MNDRKYLMQLIHLGVLKKAEKCYDCKYLMNYKKCKICSTNYDSLFEKMEK